MNNQNENPNEICLDTNIFIGMFSPDEQSENSDLFLSALLTSASAIYCPSLVNFEVLKAASQKEKTVNASPEATKKILKEFFKLPIMLVWNQDLVNETLNLHRHGARNIYDASFLALAKIRKATLITEDKEMIKLGRKLDIACASVKEWMRDNA